MSTREKIMCDDCAPEFGCWAGNEACRKQPLNLFGSPEWLGSEGILGEIGCLFPLECCMPGEHYTSECHTPEHLMSSAEAKAYRKWLRLTNRERRKERALTSTPEAQP